MLTRQSGTMYILSRNWAVGMFSVWTFKFFLFYVTFYIGRHNISTVGL
jgi:hypothetical protein